mmetsp:Transcript_30414/g.40155  ORF Transcript_30414/g.40155 Transcript_30414/m.40155 type:complete len:534 (+) Transcript_30414:217-1818(+)
MVGSNKTSIIIERFPPKVWFSNCIGCNCEQPTDFCHDCCQAFCESCCCRRHEVGKYQNHTTNIQKISAFLEMTCHDCKDSFPITDHVYCKDCSIFLCKICDQYLHIEGGMKTHDREKYTSPNQSLFFFCPGCPETNPSTPKYWCHDCEMAYCANDNETRHRSGKYQSHTTGIEEINENLKLKCNDCKSDNALKELLFCLECNALYCKVCDPYAHTIKAQHQRSCYATQGTVISLSLMPEQQKTWMHGFFSIFQATKKRSLRLPKQPNAPIKKKTYKTALSRVLCWETEDILDDIDSGDEENVPFLLQREVKKNGVGPVRPGIPLGHATHLQCPKDQQPKVFYDATNSATDTKQCHQLRKASQDSSTHHRHIGWGQVSNASETKAEQDVDLVGSDEDLEFFKEELKTSGINVIKHGRSGKVKEVKLTCNEDCTTLYWSSPRSKHSVSSASPNQVDFVEINEVRAGIQPDPDYPRYAGTPVLRKSLHPSKANRALSLIWEERSLDLQFQSVEECAHSYTGFTLLTREKKIGHNDF